jgi:hypothetical protein
MMAHILSHCLMNVKWPFIATGLYTVFCTSIVTSLEFNLVFQQPLSSHSLSPPSTFLPFAHCLNLTFLFFRSNLSIIQLIPYSFDASLPNHSPLHFGEFSRYLISMLLFLIYDLVYRN